MNTLHPHWHSLDEGERSVPVHAIKKHGNPGSPGMQPISRKPAALLGMILVASIGVTLFYATSNESRQLVASTVTVRITAEGLNPPRITVEPGDTIQWINEQVIPQILSSSSLCNEANECLVTPTAFQEEGVEFVVPADIPSGTYTYSSEISQDLSGEIIVSAQSDPPPASDQLSPPAENSPPPLSTGLPPLPPLNTALSPPTQDIPTNPNTNANARSVPQNPNRAGTLPPVQEHKPFSQPQTGAGTWIASIVFLTSAVILTWRTRRMLKYRA